MSAPLPNGITIQEEISSTPNDKITYYLALNSNNENYQQQFTLDDYLYVLTSEHFPQICDDDDQDNFVKLPLTSSQAQEMLQVLCQIFFQLHFNLIPHPIISLENIGISYTNDRKDEFKYISLQDYLFEKCILQNNDIDFDDQYLAENPNQGNLEKCDLDRDMYNLGALMYRMLKGKFYQETSDRKEVDISDDWKDLLSKMLTSDKNKRIKWNEIGRHRVLTNLMEQSVLLDKTRMRVKFTQEDIDLFYENKLKPTIFNGEDMGIYHMSFMETDYDFAKSDVYQHMSEIQELDGDTTTDRRSTDASLPLHNSEQEQKFILEIEAEQNKYLFLKEIIHLLCKTDYFFSDLENCAEPILIKGLLQLALFLNYRLLKNLHQKQYHNFDQNFLELFRVTQKAKDLAEIISEDSEILETHYIAALKDCSNYFTTPGQYPVFTDFFNAFKDIDLALNYPVDQDNQALDAQSPKHSKFISNMLKIFNKKQSAIEIQIYDTAYFQYNHNIRISSKVDFTKNQMNSIVSLLSHQWKLLDNLKNSTKQNVNKDKIEFKQLHGSLELLKQELTLEDGKYPFFERSYQYRKNALYYTDFLQSLGQ